MSRRKLKDLYKIQILSVKRQAKKDKQEQQKPTFRNLAVEYNRVEDKNINIIVTDILEPKEKEYQTVVIKADKTGATFIVTQIRCPLCNNTLELNTHWNGFFCQPCNEQSKRIFEIKKVL